MKSKGHPRRVGVRDRGWTVTGLYERPRRTPPPSPWSRAKCQSHKRLEAVWREQ